MAALSLGLTTGAQAPVTLRPYQQEGVADIRGMMRTHRRVLFVLPTGGGKTVIFSYITGQTSRRGRRVVIVAHRVEIVRQISRALDRQGVVHGIIAPGHSLTDDAVQVAMIQTLVRRLDRIEEPDLLVIDEAHHAVAGSWDQVKSAWPNAFHLGVSATPERLDGKGLRFAFDVMVLGPSPSELIEMGSLAEYTYLAPPSELDLSGVHSRGGDYALDELAQAMEATQIVGDAVKHYRQHLDGKPAICFCISVAHAEQVAERFRAAGISAASVDGSMGKGERDAILQGLESGRIKVVTSCDLISEGFDVPAVAGAILLRPTKSLALFLQQVGRALRPKADGSKAVILDHVGNCHRHGFPDWTRDWSLDGRPKKAEAPDIAVCKLCFRALPAIVARSPSFQCGGLDDQICPFKEVKEGGKPREIQEVDGELAQADLGNPLDPLRPTWARGIHLRDAKGREWFRLLDIAGTDLDRLKEIARARAYKRGWAQHQLAKRHEMDVEVQDILDGASTSDASDAALWAITRLAEVPHHVLASARAELNQRRQQAA